MTEQSTTTRAAPAGKSWLRTLLLGRGQPRLRVGSVLAALLWAGAIGFIYPYALSVARWPSDARYVGVGLLGLCVLLLWLLLRAAGRVVWHLGLIWLLLVALALFGGATAARARAAGSTAPADLVAASGGVAADVGRTAGAVFAQALLVPGDLYTAISNQAPPWQAPPAAVLDPMELQPVSAGDELVLASEQEPDGITRGVLVRARTDDGSAVRLRVAPGAENELAGRVDAGVLLIVTGGPRLVGDEIWWQVSDAEQEGWSRSDLLVLVSR